MPSRTTALAALLFLVGCVGQTGPGNSDGGPLSNPDGSTGGGSAGAGAIALSTLITSDAEVGKAGKLRVTLINPASADTVVTLASSSPAIATVAATVTVPRGALTVEADWQALAIGNTQFSATLGDTQLSATASVIQAFACGQYPNTFALEAGADQVTNLYCGGRFPDSRAIALSSSDPAVATVPAGRSSPYQYSTTISVHGVAVGTATVLIDSRPIATVRVVDQARLSSASLSTAVAVGSQVVINAYADAVVATRKSVSVAGLGPTVSLDLEPGGSSGQVTIVPTAAGVFPVTLTLGASTLTRTVRVVSAPSLATLNADRQPVALVSANGQSNLNLSLDVAVAAPVDVTLSSSDPAVLPVPAKVTIGAGSSTSIPLAPLKVGTVIITGSSGGVTVTTAISVVATDGNANPNGNNLYLSFNTQRVLVGGVGTLSVGGAQGPVTLTSSDPTVIAVPGTVPGGYSNLSYFGAKAGTTTITAVSGSQSATTQLQVIATQTLSFNGERLDLAPGATGAPQLSLAAPPADGTVITFDSSAPGIVAAPAPVTASNAYLQVSIKGLANGSALITAHLGSASASLVVNVSDGSSQVAGLTYSYPHSAALQVGALTSVIAGLNLPVTSPAPVTVTFVPPNIAGLISTPPTFAPGATQTLFAIKGLAAGTTQVTVQALGLSQSFSMTVVTAPTLSLYLLGTAKVGETLVGTVQGDATLAHDVSFTITSSVGAVASVPATVNLGLNDGEQNPSSSFAVHALTAGTSTITVTSGTTVLTQLVTVSP